MPVLPQGLNRKKGQKKMKNYRMTVAFLTNEADVKKAKELAKAKADVNIKKDREAFERAVGRLIQIKDEHDELLAAAEVLKAASAKGD